MDANHAVEDESLHYLNTLEQTASYDNLCIVRIDYSIY